MTAKLDNLHVDVLDRILDEMYYPYMYLWDEKWSIGRIKGHQPASGLLPLSLVCKRLRAQILPWIFRDVTFSFGGPRTFLPGHLLSHILVFRFRHVAASTSRSRKKRLEYIRSRDEVYQQLLHLHNIHTVHLWTSAYTTSLICALAALPRLSSLVLYDSSRMIDDDVPFHQFRGLRRLLHVNTDLMEPSELDEPRRETFGKKLLTVVQSSATSLVHLDVPGGYIGLEALGRLPLVALQTLVLRGPIISPPSNLICGILCATPSLRVLEVHLLVIGGDTAQFTVIADDSDSIPDDLCTRLLFNLRELTIANPNPLDRIFPHLPSDIEFLSLPAIKFFVHHHRRSELAMSANPASHILAMCNALHLVELRVSVQGELPPSVLHMAASSFPFLRKLEVRHRYRVDEDRNVIKESEYPPSDYATAFAAFQQLRELNVDWPLTNTGDPDDYPFVSSRGHHVFEMPPPPCEMHAFATLAARSVPSLLWIRFAESKSSTNTQLPWSPYKITRVGPHEATVSQIENLRPDHAEILQVIAARTKIPAPELDDNSDYDPPVVIEFVTSSDTD